MEGNDVSPTEMKGDEIDGSAQGGELSINIKLLLGVEVVPAGIGEIGFNGGSALLQNGADHDSSSDHELAINVKDGGVTGELKEEGSNHGVTKSGGLVGEGVIVGKEGIADSKNIAGDFGDRVPEVELLRGGSKGVVVPREGVESSQLNPAATKLLGGITNEPADISSDIGNSKHLEV